MTKIFTLVISGLWMQTGMEMVHSLFCWAF
jgi:hypothetical protein